MGFLTQWKKDYHHHSNQHDLNAYPAFTTHTHTHAHQPIRTNKKGNRDTRTSAAMAEPEVSSEVGSCETKKVKAIYANIRVLKTKHDMRWSAGAAKGLDAKIEQLLINAIAQAKDNGRKTLKACQVSVLSRKRKLQRCDRHPYTQ